MSQKVERPPMERPIATCVQVCQIQTDFPPKNKTLANACSPTCMIMNSKDRCCSWTSPAGILKRKGVFHTGL